jgi:hypothetical protein
MPTLVGRVLFEARRGGWLPRLLDWAVREPYPRVAAVAGDLLAGPGLWSRTCVGDDPFLGRPVLRQMLRVAITHGNSPVLAVTGPPGSGRSYTARFVEHVGTALGVPHTPLIDLGDVLADSAAAVGRMRRRLGLPPGAPSVDRLVDDLRPGERCILMLDGLDGAGPESAPILLADRLRDRPAPGLILVLLGLDPGRSEVPVERVEPITAAHVAEHLAEVATRAGLVFEPGVSDQFTGWVLRGQPPAREIGDRVRRLGAALSRRAAS